MPKKSSIFAKIKDTLTSLNCYIADAQVEMAGHMDDSEKYRELKPMLNKLAALNNTETNNHNSQETTGQETIGQEATDATDQKETSKHKRKKKGANAENTNGEESNSNSGQ